eukprot:7388775-Prymnesium_polylepis.2
MSGESQRLPRWLGPPVVSRIRFQSTQPVHQCSRSSRIWPATHAERTAHAQASRPRDRVKAVGAACGAAMRRVTCAPRRARALWRGGGAAMAARACGRAQGGGETTPRLSWGCATARACGFPRLRGGGGGAAARGRRRERRRQQQQRVRRRSCVRARGARAR